MKANSLFLVLLILTLYGCDKGLNANQEKAASYLCGSNYYEFFRENTAANVGRKSVEAIDSYDEGRYLQSVRKLESLIELGCDATMVYAFLTLSFFQLGDLEKATDTLVRAFAQSGRDLKIIEFVGFQLESSKKLAEAMIVYQFGMSEIRLNLRNGISRESMRSSITEKESGELLLETATEETLLYRGYCNAQAMKSKLEIEFANFFKAVHGKSPPVCIAPLD